MQITIVGGGNMGLTFAKAFINSHVVKSDQLTILEKQNSAKVSELRKLNLCNVTTDLNLLSNSDIIILAVKPQDSAALFSTIKSVINDSKLVISIMAGVKVGAIKQALGIPKVIRSMPNLPSQIGIGMTVFTASDAVTRSEVSQVQNLLATTGKTLFVEDERLIDTSTAVSGSGPAYVFYVMDAMIKAAITHGMQSGEAETMVVQTIKGSLELFKQSSSTCQEWIAKVASRGGTTETAIRSFETNHVNQSIQEGIAAAYQRAVELGA